MSKRLSSVVCHDNERIISKHYGGLSSVFCGQLAHGGFLLWQTPNCSHLLGAHFVTRLML